MTIVVFLRISARALLCGSDSYFVSVVGALCPSFLAHGRRFNGSSVWGSEIWEVGRARKERCRFSIPSVPADERSCPSCVPSSQRADSVIANSPV